MRFEVSHIFKSSEHFEVSPSTSEYFEANPGQSKLIRVIRSRTHSPVQLLSLPIQSMRNCIPVFAAYCSVLATGVI